jgi:hypothetical protein
MDLLHDFILHTQHLQVVDVRTPREKLVEWGARFQEDSWALVD